MNSKRFENQYRLLIADFIRSVRGSRLGKTEMLAVCVAVFHALSTGWIGDRPTLGNMLVVGKELFEGETK